MISRFLRMCCGVGSRSAIITSTTATNCDDSRRPYTMPALELAEVDDAAMTSVIDRKSMGISPIDPSALLRNGSAESYSPDMPEQPDYPGAACVQLQ